ncbi:sensor histidine kinase [Cellulosilyticum sp. I15G10I2]|uniref:sensor histidine kinase n=1 Tax=Cellulosilyticum sp. I15G10I2 TaxID=1892843 RepID=UPI001FA75AE2|nr:ATP-binding protein [Cellulosilyticum sp. I15G10I2]
MIENAIIHGLQPKVDAGHLQVQIWIRASMLCFCIKDDGIGMTDEEIANFYDQFKSSNENKAIGLKNVYRRLQLIYAKEGIFILRVKKIKE